MMTEANFTAQTTAPADEQAQTTDIPGGGLPLIGPFIKGVNSTSDALSGVAGAISAFYQVLTNTAIWASLGWLVLGVGLMILGLALWLGKDAKGYLPPIVPV